MYTGTDEVCEDASALPLNLTDLNNGVGDYMTMSASELGMVYNP